MSALIQTRKAKHTAYRSANNSSSKFSGSVIVSVHWRRDSRLPKIAGQEKQKKSVKDKQRRNKAKKRSTTAMPILLMYRVEPPVVGSRRRRSATGWSWRADESRDAVPVIARSGSSCPVRLHTTHSQRPQPENVGHPSPLTLHGSERQAAS